MRAPLRAALSLLLVSPVTLAQQTPDEAVAEVSALWANRGQLGQEDLDEFVGRCLEILEATEGRETHYLTHAWGAVLGWNAADQGLRQRAFEPAARYWEQYRMEDFAEWDFEVCEYANLARSGYATVLASKSRYPEAAGLQEQVVALWDELLKEGRLDDEGQVAKAEREATLSRGELAVTYSRMGRADKAVRLGRDIVKYFAEKDPDHPERPRYVRNLAQALAENGEGWNDELVELQQWALDQYERWIDGEDEELKSYAKRQRADALWEMADFIRYRGDQVRALALAQESFDELSELYGKTAPETCSGRGVIAIIQNNLANFGVGIPLLETNREILEAHLDPFHDTVKRVRTNLSAATMRDADRKRAAGQDEAARAGYEKAIALLELAIEDYNKNPTSQMRELAAAYEYLALCLVRTGDYERALEELDRADAAASNQHNEMTNRTTRATLLRRTGKYAEAADLCEDTLPSMRAHGGYDEVPPVMREYILACAALDEPERLRRALVQVLEYVDWRLADCSMLPSRPSFQLARVLGDSLDVVWSFVPAGDVELQRRTFELMESLRGVTLRNAHLQSQALSDPEVAASLREAQMARARLARLTVRGEGANKDLFETTLHRDAAEFAALLEVLEGKDLEPARLSLDDLRTELSEQSVAVAFRRVTVTGLGAEDADSSEEDRLFLFVVDHEGELRFRDLGPADDIAGTAREWWLEIQGGWRAGVPLGSSDAGKRRGDAHVKLLEQQLIVPLRGLVGKARTLLVCLDDELHRIPVEEIETVPVDEDDTPLEFRFFNTLLDLAPTSLDVEDPSLFAVGGLDYSPDEKTALPGGTRRGATPLLAPIDRAGTLKHFDALMHSGEELRKVAELFPGEKSVTLDGDRATLAQFREGIQGAHFVHLATHGYYYTTLKDERSRGDVAWNKTVSEFAPMLLCGLALSGANTNQAVITAEEIAAMDLSSCRLAVLSACESYLGLSQRGHGLASLQAAFHSAGARTVLTARWEVDDRAASMFMQAFYRALWKGGMSAPDALAKAKFEVKRDGYQEPKFWAAWILTGAR